MFSSQFCIKPKILVFFVSYSCNLRCIMCSSWIKQRESKEASLEEIGNIFNGKILKNNLEVINITGGEPTLRDDLVQIIKIILNSCHKLKQIDISTNGVNTPQVVDKIERILALLLPAELKLSVSISIDGVGETHEQVRQSPGIFAKIEQTIDSLKELMFLYPFFSVGFNMTISNINSDKIEEVYIYAKKRGVGVSFTLSAISDIGVESIRAGRKFEIEVKKKDGMSAFFKRLSESGDINHTYADFLLTWLSKGERKGSCAFRQGKSVLLEPTGELYLCGNFREFRLGNIFKTSFDEMIKHNKIPYKDYKIKCQTCNSNCYIDSAH